MAPEPFRLHRDEVYVYSVSMIVATWNVNSVNARLERLLAFLAKAKPDYLCLQELKTTEDKFPFAAIKAAGYESLILGQKSYNGVAILARYPHKAILCPLEQPDPLAQRLLAAEIVLSDGSPVTLVSAYVPNGRAISDAEYPKKLEWLRSCAATLAALRQNGVPLMVAGDFNVAPEDRDVHDPDLWREQILCSSLERQAYESFSQDLGLVDVYRQLHTETGRFSWWDYRNLSFPKNLGLRIDLVLGESALAARCVESWIDREERKGQKPSDHAPVCVRIG